MSIIAFEGAKLEYRVELALKEIRALAEECQKLDLDNPDDYAKLLENQEKFAVIEKQIDALNKELEVFIKYQKRQHLKLIK